MRARAIAKLLSTVCLLTVPTSCSSDDVPPPVDDSPSSAADGASAPTAGSEGPRDLTLPVVVGGIELEPECEPSPEDVIVETFFATLVTGGGGRRVFPDDPAFPSDYCPEGALFASVRTGGLNAAGTGTIGDWEWTGRGWCSLPGGILWSHHDIETELGTISALEESRVIVPDGCRLGAPCDEPASFEGLFTVSGGTGRYDGARGRWRLVSRQRGDGTTAGVLCGWLDYPE